MFDLFMIVNSKSNLSTEAIYKSVTRWSGPLGKLPCHFGPPLGIEKQELHHHEAARCWRNNLSTRSNLRAVFNLLNTVAVEKDVSRGPEFPNSQSFSNTYAAYLRPHCSQQTPRLSRANYSDSSLYNTLCSPLPPRTQSCDIQVPPPQLNYVRNWMLRVLGFRDFKWK